MKQKDKSSKDRITNHTQYTKNVIQRDILPVQALQTVKKKSCRLNFVLVYNSSSLNISNLCERKEKGGKGEGREMVKWESIHADQILSYLAGQPLLTCVSLYIKSGELITKHQIL